MMLFSRDGVRVEGEEKEGNEIEGGKDANKDQRGLISGALLSYKSFFAFLYCNVMHST